MADTEIGTAYGITTLPHLRSLSVVGPHRVTGVSDTPSRRMIFTCRPTALDEEKPCADSIVRRLATLAFRRPVNDRDFERLMAFYARGRADRNFEYGITKALEAILASPQFVFRVEETPVRTTTAGYRLGEYELASRLSFFLWGGGPDEELLKAAGQARLERTGRAGEAGEADDGRPAGRRAVHAFRVAVAAPAGPGAHHPGSDPVPLRGPDAVGGAQARDRAVLREPGARRSQPARVPDRRLHLRQRPRRAALRHPQRRRVGVPPGDGAGVPARHPRPRQRAGA